MSSREELVDKAHLGLRVGIDVGGTFTDLVAFDLETGQYTRDKALTSQPESAAVGALLEALSSDGRRDEMVLHATTVVTNLLIQGSGSRVGLLATKGFKDILEIGLSIRPNPFNYVRFRKPEPLVARHLRVGIEERVDADGKVLIPLDQDEVTEAIRYLVEDQGCEAIAVCLLHSFANPEHEKRIGESIMRLAPDVSASLSHEVDPTIREYERTCTTAINAAAQPRIETYVRSLENVRPGILFMHSGGGVFPSQAAARRPAWLAHSGPAAGVLAGVYLSRLGAGSDLITFDMGGTSCDVALIQGGSPSLSDSIDVSWHLPIRTLAIEVESIGAGGGSIAWLDEGGALRVGPQSAGANPGPASYSLGGEAPTVTDANLALGILGEDLLGGRLRLDAEAAVRALSALEGRYGVSVRDVAAAVHRIVSENMALAIRRITVDRGIDPRGFSIVSFGGAGGQAACSVAESLGIGRVVIPPHASTFSALGLLAADIVGSQARTVMDPLTDEGLDRALSVYREVLEEASDLLGPAAQADDVVSECRLDLRYVGQSHFVTIEAGDLGGATASVIISRFEREHDRLFGTQLGDPVEIVNVRASVRRQLETVPLEDWPEAKGEVVQRGERVVHLEDRMLPVLDKTSLHRGWSRSGPMILEEFDSTYYVPAGWRASAESPGMLVLERSR